MVIMALDHIRDYFHADAFFYGPTDLTKTTVSIFFTRWITHFCAPAFSFLAGASAFFIGQRKNTGDLSGFLFKRGLWLIFIEITLVTFAWYFDFQFRTINLYVIWSLGISMIFLAGVVHLPRTVILMLSCIMIFGHDLLDNVHYHENVLWAMFHDKGIFNLSTNFKLDISYPVVPWIGVMSLGYCFGSFYNKSFDTFKRRRILTIIGISAIVLFVILRYTNIYGEPLKWEHFNSTIKTFMSFINLTKYPPSLLYLLMTLGLSILFLANAEKLKGRIVNFFTIFGRVPFFYYILHLYLIHLLAMIAAQLSGFGWQKLILPGWITEIPELKGYGFNLGIVYIVWIGTIALLFPLCKKFDTYKMNHKEKWWLSYL